MISFIRKAVILPLFSKAADSILKSVHDLNYEIEVKSYKFLIIGFSDKNVLSLNFFLLYL